MKTASKPVPQALPNQSDQISLGLTSPSATGTAAAPPKRKAVAAKTKELVCRYCGSDDFVRSFRQGRDARCRACFKKRYGAGARSNKSGRPREATAAK